MDVYLNNIDVLVWSRHNYINGMLENILSEKQTNKGLKFAKKHQLTLANSLQPQKYSWTGHSLDGSQ